ncbi:MAG: glycine cleavage T C-terminal barrel domain-containing protein [Anaerolineales bacterium]
MNLPPLVYYLPPASGLLHLTGPDRVAFLQRQTTNDVTRLAPACAVTTVLTSPTARILDVLQLFEDGETIGILPLPGHAETTFAYLRRRIFFNDHVTLSNASAEYTILNLEGKIAGDWLRAQGLEPPLLDRVTTGTLNGIPLRVIGHPGLAGIGYRMLARAGVPMLDLLTHSGLPALSPEDYEIFRVEAGLPAPGHELTEDYTPHETNLTAWISETKGCYTGQEILARQVTYDKITRHLVGLRLDVPALSGATVLAEGKSVGTITSAVVSPRLGPIALAILKRPYHEPGTSLTVEAETGNGAAIVTTLPFS